MAADLFQEAQIAFKFPRQYYHSGEELRHDCVIIGDEAFFRVEMAKNLKKIPMIRLLGEGSRAHYIQTKLDNLIPDLALVNVKVGGGIPIPAIRMLKEWYPDLLVLVIAGYTEPSLVKRILITGANGYLICSNLESHLDEAVRSLLAGKIYIDSDLINPMLEDLNLQYQINCDEGKGIEHFSEKEFNVFIRLGQGLSCREVSRITGLSLSTVRYCIRSLRSCLKMESSSLLKAYATEWVSRVL